MRRCFEFFDPGGIAGSKVLVKPNFNTADAPPGSTHNDTLDEILNQVRKRGPAALSVGDRSASPTEEVLRDKGIDQVALQHEADVVNFDDLPPEQWKHFAPADSHWPEGFSVAAPVLDADYLVWSPCLKTHQFGGVFTMSLKLAVGVVPRRGTEYMSHLHSSPHQEAMIAEINQVFQPDLIILDGIVAFVDGGPGTGEVAQLDLFLAATDRVAIDAVAVAALKLAGTKDEIQNSKIYDLGQIRRAVELGLGARSPDDIQIVTDDEGSRGYADQLEATLRMG